VTLVGGCEQPRSELVVRVDSEVAWGAGQSVQSVVLTVRRGGAMGPLRDTRTTVLGAGAGRLPLPLYVGVIPADDDTATPVWIEALGCGAPNGCMPATARVAQRAVVRFTRGQTEEVTLLLASACAGVRCASEQRCAVGSGQCEAATRAQETVRPFNGTDAAVLDAPADHGRITDSGGDISTPADATMLDVPAAMDATLVDVVLASDDGSLLCPVGRTRCGTACRDLTSDPGNCGACGAVCALAQVTAATCASGACGVELCATNFADCDSVATNGCEVDTRSTAAHCGGCGRTCPSLQSCIAGGCTATTPRPMAPLSTAIVSSRRPTLRWSLASGMDGAAVEICRDRACTSVLTTFSASGTRGAPAMDLPAGVLFWRLRGQASGVTDTHYSSTWQFTVGARTAPVNTSSGTVADFNGDGYADLVVGAPGALSNTGRAYVYLGSAGGLAAMPSTTLTGPDGAEGSFGYSVASAGDVNGDGYADLVVGAYRVGRTYVYLGSASGLASTPATALTCPDSANVSSVAGVGDVNGDGYADLVVGANGAMSLTGRVYVYLGSAGGLATTPTTVLTGPDGPGGLFGRSVAGTGDINGDGYADLVVGASSAMSLTGRVYVYLGSGGGLATTPATALTGPDGAGGNFGFSVANAGDINGDGYADLVVGAYQAMSSTGRVFVYLGSATGLVATPAAALTGPDGVGRYFGCSVASAGDVNGDGYADLVVGALQVGGAYVYLGSAGGLPMTPSTALTAPIASGGVGAVRNFGRSVASAGDVNGDGYADLVVGATGEGPQAGWAYFYVGSASGLAATPATSLTGPDDAELGRGFGYSVASATDLHPRGPVSGLGSSAYGRPCQQGGRITDVPGARPLPRSALRSAGAKG